MHRFLIACFLLSAAMSLAGCDLFPTRTSDEDLLPIQTAELKAMLDDEKSAVALIDVRTPARYQKEHLPGAVNIPLPDMAANDARLANAKNIVVYGSGWTDPLSRAGAKRLLAIGYKNVYDYRGGLELWKSDGHRTIVDPNAAATQPAK